MKIATSKIDTDFIKTNTISDFGSVQEIYRTVLQEEIRLTPCKNLVGQIGRGSGKSTVMFSERLVNVSYAMPRSLILLCGPTYTFILETIVPAIVTYLAQYYTRGVHYEYGKKPPSWFKLPYTEVSSYKHTISFAWGTVIQFVSIDRPESAIGKNAVHVFVDEALRMRELEFRERILPALRSDRTVFGHSQYYGGLTLFSSTPNLENDHDWWLQFKSEMNLDKMKDVQLVSYRVSLALGQLVSTQAQIDKIMQDGVSRSAKRLDRLHIEKEKLNRFVSRWQIRLSEQLMRNPYWWYYAEGSSFSNLAVLGLDYMQQQLSATKSNFDKFKLSILNIRPESVKNKFFAKFDVNRHIYNDSYVYNYNLGHRSDKVDNYSIEDVYTKTSLDLKHCDLDAPLIFGYDPGNFASLIVAQSKKRVGGQELRVLKNFWTITPEEHVDLAEKITTFFSSHRRKVIYLYYDRAANQRKQRYAQNTKGNTDAEILKTLLQDKGWTVHLENLGQRTIFHWEHYLLLSRLLSERENITPHIRFCQNECEELISSIQMSPLKKTADSLIELDKSSETRLEYADQVLWSTQLATALMYMLWGLYSALKPEGSIKNIDIEGL